MIYILTCTVDGVPMVTLETPVLSIAQDLHKKVMKATEIGGKDYEIIFKRDDGVILNRVCLKDGVFSTQTLASKESVKSENKAMMLIRRAFA